MRLNWKLVLGVTACLLLAGGAYLWATALMDSLYTYQSPLHDNPPMPGEPLLPPGARRPVQRVVIVLIDALRVDTALDAQVMPTLAELRQQGAHAVMHSVPPSYSETAYTVLMTGAWPDISDGPAINHPYEEIPTWTQDNLFSAAQRSGLKTAVSGYYWFEKLIPQQAVNASFYTPLEDRTADRQVVDAALPWLESGDYNLVLVHLDQVDYAGHHEGGPQDPRWDEAARRADDLLREITSEMDFAQDTLLVVSDHGQIDRGGHGGQDTIVLQEPFVLAGARVKAGDYGDVDMVDVAPTLAALLGTNLPATNQGLVLTEMFDLPEEVLAALPGAAEDQKERLFQAYINADGFETDISRLRAHSVSHVISQRINDEIPGRAALVGMVAILSFGLAVWLGKRELLLLVGLGILYLLLFNLRYAVIDGLTYSLSSVTGANDLIIYCAVTSLAALLVCWIVWLVMRRLLRKGAGKVASMGLGLTLVIIYLLSLPILWSYVLNGVLITWHIPDFGTMFIAFLSLIQVLFVAVWGLVLSGLSTLLAWISGRRGQEST